jgi:acetyl esterase/lipase
MTPVRRASKFKIFVRRRRTSAASILNFLSPRFGIEITRSVSYGDGPRHTLDVYRPAAAGKVPVLEPVLAPVIVFFYGGSWQRGRKALYGFLGTALARRGYVTLVADYRLYPEVRYPAFLEDGARAVRWAKDNAAWFGGDRRRVFVMGHSAGAYIAAMLALDSRWLAQQGLAPGQDIAGLIGVAGPYDFLPLRGETLKRIFNGGNDPATQPITHVTPGAPPALLMTGVDDGLVEPGNSTRLAARLRDAGNEATVVAYPRTGHITIMGAFAAPLRFLAPVLRDADAFMVRNARAALTGAA